MSALILYMEDDTNNRMLIHRVLQAENFDVISAQDADSGIKMALELLPDVILMDISMPSKDGYTATNELRQYPELDGIPIIAVTANVLAGDRETALSAGCDGYIPKPIDVDTFPDEIRAYMNQDLGYAYSHDLTYRVSQALGDEASVWRESPPDELFPLLKTRDKQHWTDFLQNQLAYGSQAIRGRAVIALALWHQFDPNAPNKKFDGQVFFWEQVRQSLLGMNQEQAEKRWAKVWQVALAMTQSTCTDIHKSLGLCMKSDYWECRQWGLSVLKSDDIKLSKTFARKACSDPINQVRTVVIDVLSTDPLEDDISILERALYDREITVRELASDGLANLKHQAGLQTLIHGLRTGQPQTAEVCANALGMMGTPDAGTELIQSLNYQRDMGVLRQIIIALGKINDRRCYQALHNLLTYENPRLRKLILKCLDNHPAR